MIPGAMVDESINKTNLEMTVLLMNTPKRYHFVN